MSNPKPTITAKTIGAILKAQRENINISQRQVAEALGYRNVNFISMIESGRSNPPLGKLPEITKAYQLDYKFVALMVKALYPEAWGTMFYILDRCQKDDGLLGADGKTNSREKVDKELDKLHAKELKKFNIRI